MYLHYGFVLTRGYYHDLERYHDFFRQSVGPSVRWVVTLLSNSVKNGFFRSLNDLDSGLVRWSVGQLVGLSVLSSKSLK